MKKPNVKPVETYFAGKKIWINEKYLNKFNLVNAHLVTYRPDIVNKIVRVDSFNQRRMTFNPMSWSYHAYGQAIDVNPLEFFHSKKKYPLPIWYSGLIMIMKSYGFRSGSDWRSIFEPMHFEIGKKE